jgi:hypothetical protein
VPGKPRTHHVEGNLPADRVGQVEVAKLFLEDLDELAADVGRLRMGLIVGSCDSSSRLTLSYCSKASRSGWLRTSLKLVERAMEEPTKRYDLSGRC